MEVAPAVQIFYRELSGCNEALDSGMSGAEATEHEVEQKSELDKHSGSVFHPADIPPGDGAGHGKARDGEAVVVVATAAGAQHDGPLTSKVLLVWYKQFLTHTAIEDVDVANVEGKAASGRQDPRPDGTVCREGGFSVVA